MCGPVPSWMANATLPYASGSHLGSSCAAVPCAAGVPLDWLADVQPLLALKESAQAVDSASADSALATWDPIVPPCTSDPNATTCYVCRPGDGACGGVRASDGARLCNWLGVACRDRRAVALDLGGVALQLLQLPPGLANGTVLETLDLGVGSAAGGGGEHAPRRPHWRCSCLDWGEQQPRPCCLHPSRPCPPACAPLAGRGGAERHAAPGVQRLVQPDALLC
jgi:hypothetical protein